MTERTVAAEASVTSRPALSVVIVSFTSRDVLRDCLSSLAVERDEVALEVIVVDNASRDGTVGMIRQEFSWVNLIENDRNVGFAVAANQALRSARGRLLLLLNPDTVVPRGTLTQAMQRLERDPAAGVLGCRLVRPDGTFDHAAKRGFPTVMTAFYYFLGLSRLAPRSRRFAHYTAGHLREDEEGYVDAVNGAFMLVKRRAYEDVGVLDEQFWLYGEDLDWCKRFGRHGWKILYWPEVSVTHVKGASSGTHRRWELHRAFHHSIWLYYRKHHAPNDPRIVRALVFVGVWTKFAFSVLSTELRRAASAVERRRSPAPHADP